MARRSRAALAPTEWEPLDPSKVTKAYIGGGLGAIAGRTPRPRRPTPQNGRPCPCRTHGRRPDLAESAVHVATPPEVTMAARRRRDETRKRAACAGPPKAHAASAISGVDPRSPCRIPGDCHGD
jgi:hypothetical protein